MRADEGDAPLKRQDARSPAGVFQVVHLAARLPVGGMERVLVHLVQHLPRERYATEAWCLEALDPLGEELARRGCRVASLGKRPGRDARLFMAIARRLRAGRTDVLHCHDELSWFYGAIGARLARVPHIVMTLHGRRPRISRRHLLEQRALFRLTRRVVAVSGCLQRQVSDELRVPAHRIHVLPNGIPLPPRASDAARARARTLLGLDSGSFAVGSVGELSPVKNLEMALEAVAAARRELPHLRYVLIGDGALRQTLERRAAASGLSEVVRFLGFRRDVADLLPGLDAYVCASHYEGTSLSVLEAMAAGCPVIATAVGGNPELIADAVSGILVPPGDARQLALALAAVAADRSRAEAMGRRARRAVEERYSLDRMIEAYDRLYLEMIGARRLPRSGIQAWGEPAASRAVEGGDTVTLATPM